MVSWKGFKQWLHMGKTELELQSLAVGVNSTVDITEDKHVILLDFDVKDLLKVEDSIRELQAFWWLSDAFLFRTRHGFHCLFFYDHVPYGRLKMIIDYARYVDDLFKYISRYYSHRTLRVAGKYKDRDIAFVKVVKGPRRARPEEIELGELKRQEHKVLAGIEYEIEKNL